MKRVGKEGVFLALIGLASLTGCESSSGMRHNKAVHDAPPYDADIYMPKYSPQFYDHHYYNDPVDMSADRPL